MWLSEQATTSALKFLHENAFDFNEWISCGVPYTRRQARSSIVHLFGPTIPLFHTEPSSSRDQLRRYYGGERPAAFDKGSRIAPGLRTPRIWRLRLLCGLVHRKRKTRARRCCGVLRNCGAYRPGRCLRHRVSYTRHTVPMYPCYATAGLPLGALELHLLFVFLLLALQWPPPLAGRLGPDPHSRPRRRKTGNWRRLCAPLLLAG